MVLFGAAKGVGFLREPPLWLLAASEDKDPHDGIGGREEPGELEDMASFLLGCCCCWRLGEVLKGWGVGPPVEDDQSDDGFFFFDGVISL